MRKNKNLKHERRLQKGKKRKREYFSYVPKGMLKLIISNIDFLTGQILAMNNFYKIDGVGSFPKILS